MTAPEPNGRPGPLQTRVTDLVAQAVLENAAGAPSRAEALLRRADRVLDRAGEAEGVPVLRARVRVTHAWSRAQRGDRAGAFAQLEEADRLLVGSPPNPVASLAAVQRAGLHGRVGEWAEAAVLLEGVRITTQVAPRTRCLLHLNLGLSYQFLGRYAQSDVRLRRAHLEAVAHGQLDLAAAALHNRGRLQMLLGDLPAALRLMTEAAELDGGVLPPAAVLDRARVLAEAGLLDRALSALADGEAAARAGGIAHDLAEADLERSRLALLRRDHREARRLAARAERRFRRRSEDAWAVRAALLRLQAELLDARPVHRVAADLLDLADGPARAGAVGVEAAVSAAEASARAGRLDDARRQLARPEVRRTASFPVRLHRSLATAELHAAEGRLDLVRRELRRGARRLAEEQARYTSLDSRTAAALHTSRLREAHLGLALRGGSPAEVLAATELWRGVSHRLPPVTGTADPEVARLTADARRLHAEAREVDDPARRALLARAAREAEAAVAHRDLASAPGRLPRDAVREMGRAVTVGELRPHLRASGTGILGLFLHGGQLHAVCVTARGAVLTRIADGPRLVDAAQRLRIDLAARRHAAGGPLAAAVDRSIRRGAQVVGQVLAPVVPRTEQLVVLPSQATASLPWRLVPEIAGRPLVVAPSATFWARRREEAALRRPRGRPGPTVTALAGPGLPRGPEEAAAVAAAWGRAGHHLGPPDATGAALAAALRERDVVHVAAHGVHEDENPLFSTVVLADGPTWVHELQRTGIGAQHVVLSSCEVGRTHLREGDEGLGLTAGLLSCGVQSVVGAVAPVGDEDSYVVMTRYHRLLSDGTGAAEALEAASADVPDGSLFAVYGSDWSRTG